MRANYFFCDRCKKLYNSDKDFNKKPKFMVTDMEKNEYKDLCPECSDDLERWFMAITDKQRGGDDDEEIVKEFKES